MKFIRNWVEENCEQLYYKKFPNEIKYKQNTILQGIKVEKYLNQLINYSYEQLIKNKLNKKKKRVVWLRENQEQIHNMRMFNINSQINKNFKFFTGENIKKNYTF